MTREEAIQKRDIIVTQCEDLISRADAVKRLTEEDKFSRRILRKMTNREWLETLSDEMLASEISTRCGLCAKQDLVECGDCVSNITTWMTQEYVPPKKELSETDIVKEFENVFQDRRAISLDEVKSTIRGLFE